MRSATPGGDLNSRASAAISANLTSTGPSVSRMTSHQLSTSGCQSSFMPMVMKNSPSSTSWKGRMSVSTWWRYSVSEISMPATKAPSARLSPACSVSQARPSVMSSRFSMNSSALLRRATSVSHQRISLWPPYSSRPSSTAAFSPAQASASAISPPLLCSAGISTSSGTTARSWNSSTPMTSRPCGLSSSSRSAISLTTMAVELIAIAAPSTSAPCQPICQARPSSAKPAISMALPATAPATVSPTWASPRPKTAVFSARSLGRLNSSPITNIRKTTPNSARYWMLAESCAKASALGPMTTPTAR